jgi:hypothetical protein
MTSRHAVDRRSKQYRRHRELVDSLAADIGGGELSTVQLALINQCALVLYRCEELQQQLLSGESLVDDDVIVRLSNSARRLHGEVMARRQKAKPPTLNEYLAETAKQP